MTEVEATTPPEDDQLLVLAFYIVVDVSFSMLDDDSIGAANELIVGLRDAIVGNPVLADLVRIGIMDFSDDAQTVLSLGDLRNVDQLKKLEVRGGTSYAAAFRKLRQEIPGDIRQLKDDGYRTHRPVVFFITDGEPTDAPADLQAAFAELTDRDFKARPNVVPFGVGKAKKADVEPFVFPPTRMRSFATQDGVNPADAIRALREVIVGSIVNSVNSVDEHGQSGGFVPPDDDDLSDWL